MDLNEVMVGGPRFLLAWAIPIDTKSLYARVIAYATDESVAALRACAQSMHADHALAKIPEELMVRVGIELYQTVFEERLEWFEVAEQCY